MQYVIWLRAVAALLIVNSHLENQHLVHYAAVDGLLGNSLFFFLAGLGLVASERNSRRGFPDWYGRRLSRIVPSVVLAILVLDYLPHQGWRSWGPFDYLRNFLAPPGFTFVEQILALYVPFFLVQRLGGRRGNGVILGLSLVVMLLVPAFGERAALFHPFHWLYYFQMMLFGAWVAWRDVPVRAVTPRLIGLFLITGLAYGAVKLATSRPSFAEWYPVLHLMVFPLIFCWVQVFQAEGLARFVDRQRWLRWTLGLVGGLTLEIYLVHYAVRDSPIVARLPFPANIAVILIGSVVLAIPLARGADWVRAILKVGSKSLTQASPGFESPKGVKVHLEKGS